MARLINKVRAFLDDRRARRRLRRKQQKQFARGEGWRGLNASGS